MSFDGFLWRYLTKEYKTQYNITTPNFDKLIENGIYIKKLRPTFPTVTIPNHYTLVTGLYPTDHGIIYNSFYDPILNDTFQILPSYNTSVWFHGDPIWNTIQREAKKNTNKQLSSAVIYWQGSYSNISGMFPNYYLWPYNASMTFPQRVDLGLTLLNSSNYSLIMIYMHDPDKTGHENGPYSNFTAQKVVEMDAILGRMYDGIASLGLLDETNLIVVSDHGMAQLYPPQQLTVDFGVFDLDEFFVNGTLRMDFISTIIGIRIILEELLSEEFVIDLFNKSILNVTYYWNIGYYKIYKRSELPEEYKYFLNGNYGYRLPHIIIVPNEPYLFDVINSVQYDRNYNDYYGTHGYNNSDQDMHTMMVGIGPNLKRGYIEEQSVDNIHLYELFCKLQCETTPMKNNGSFEEIEQYLL